MTTQTRKTALNTGVTGPDGSCLAEFLLEKGYEVHGIKRDCAAEKAWVCCGCDRTRCAR